MTEEKPLITPEHVEFNSRIVAIAQTMTRYAIEQINAVHGAPPSERARELLGRFAALDLRFISTEAGQLSSRQIACSVAGSDALSFERVAMPTEAFMTEPPDMEYPARILTTRLHYQSSGRHGLREVDYFLYTGPDAAPAFVNLKAAHSLSDVDYDAFSALGVMQDRFKNTHGVLYYPNERELQAVRLALELVIDDVDIYEILQTCHTVAGERVPENAEYLQDALWFGDQVDRQPPL